MWTQPAIRASLAPPLPSTGFPVGQNVGQNLGQKRVALRQAAATRLRRAWVMSPRSNAAAPFEAGAKPRPRTGRVAIIVLSYNRRDDLLECLESVRQLAFRERDVLVFDNASDDGSAEAAEALGSEIRVVRSDQNLGAPAGRNTALSSLRRRLARPGGEGGDEECGYDAVLFLDDDSRVDAEFLDHAHRALCDDPEVGIVCGRAYTAWPSRTLLTVGTEIGFWSGTIRDLGEGEADSGQFDEPRYVDACGSFGMLVRWDVFERLGGFDERYSPYGFEDYDLCLRASRLGYRTLYAPKAIVYHKGCKLGRGPVARYERAKARNYLRLLYAHARPLQRMSRTLWLPVGAAPVLLGLALRGHAPSLAAQLRGVLDVLRAPGDER